MDIIALPLHSVRDHLNWVHVRALTLYRHNRYRFLFAIFTLSVTWSSAAIMYAIQRTTTEPAEILEAWYIAISSFSSTGLAIVDITQWHWSAQVVMLLTVEIGSLPICSAIPSILRLGSLRGVEVGDNAKDAELVKRHKHVNLAIVWSSVVYWFVVQLVAFFSLAVLCGKSAWWAIFHTVSGFNNAGFGLDTRSFAYPDVVEHSGVLVTFILLMPMGNTLFPVWQRMLVRCWIPLLRGKQANPSDALASQSARGGTILLFSLSRTEMADALLELLQSPHVYYTHLFSMKRTCILFSMWCGLTLVDFLMFIPDYGTNAFISTRREWLQALFQTVTVRTAGFSIMDLTQVQLGHLIYWVMAMYLSAYPFVITNKAVTESAPSLEQEEELRFIHNRINDATTSDVTNRAEGGLAETSGHPSDWRHAVGDDFPFSHSKADDPAASAVVDERGSETELVNADVSPQPSRRTSSGSSTIRAKATVPEDGSAASPLSPDTRTRFFPDRRANDSMQVAADEVAADGGSATPPALGNVEASLRTMHRLPQQMAKQVVHQVSALATDVEDTIRRAQVRERLEEISSSAQSTVAHEIGWLYIACLLIAYAEGYDLTGGADAAPVMRILFEVASAYGTVGLSLSSSLRPTLSYSAIWGPFAQFLVILLMYFGKFRGLPQTVELKSVNHLIRQRCRRRSACTAAQLSASETAETFLSSNSDHVASIDARTPVTMNEVEPVREGLAAVIPPVGEVIS